MPTIKIAFGLFSLLMVARRARKEGSKRHCCVRACGFRIHPDCFPPRLLLLMFLNETLSTVVSGSGCFLKQTQRKYSKHFNGPFFKGRHFSVELN